MANKEMMPQIPEEKIGEAHQDPNLYKKMPGDLPPGLYWDEKGEFLVNENGLPIYRKEEATPEELNKFIKELTIAREKYPNEDLKNLLMLAKMSRARAKEKESKWQS